jgi:virginiamycin B lyase
MLKVGSVGFFVACAALAVTAGCGNGSVITGGPVPTASPVTPSVTNQFAVTTGNSGPFDITSNSADGFLYFTEQNASKIGKMGTGGSLTEYATKTANAKPAGIIRGLDNNIWFGEGAGNVGTFNISSNAVTEYAVGTAVGYLTNGPGTTTMYFTEPVANAIGNITTGGVVGTAVPIPTANAQPLGITTGPDLNVWFTESTVAKIGQLNPTTGTITEFPISPATNPTKIVVGPDSAMWFTENIAGGPKLGRLSTTFQYSEYPLTGAKSATGLTVGADGNFYFLDPTANEVGRFVVSSQQTAEYPVSTANAGLTDAVLGPDSRIYFTEFNGNKIGQLSYF